MTPNISVITVTTANEATKFVEATIPNGTDLDYAVILVDLKHRYPEMSKTSKSVKIASSGSFVNLPKISNDGKYRGTRKERMQLFITTSKSLE